MGGKLGRVTIRVAHISTVSTTSFTRKLLLTQRVRQSNRGLLCVLDFMEGMLLSLSQS
jgi:hypothetical protein